MKRRILCLLLQSKIMKELKDFDAQIYGMDTEKIIARAGEIDTKYALAKALLDLLPCLAEDTVRLLFLMNGIIDYFYDAMPSQKTERYDSAYIFLCRNLLPRQPECEYITKGGDAA